MRLLRNSVFPLGALALCGALSGCLHHEAVTPVVAQSKTPNIYVPPPEQATLPPMKADPPPTLTDAKPVEAEEVKPKKRTKRQTPPPAPVAVTPPPVPASDPPPVETATLGALGSGGDANPKQQQEVAGKIGAVDKRLNDLPATVAEREQKQIAKVRLFLKEASDALKGGDAEGAGILATKAELLLDDLTK